jgi:hypothetical protein
VHVQHQDENLSILKAWDRGNAQHGETAAVQARNDACTPSYETKAPNTPAKEVYTVAPPNIQTP